MNRVVIGVDEVGRGCLAGPVYAAAVILPEPRPIWVENIRDSKKLSAKKRNALAEKIELECQYAVREVSSAAVDDMNVLYASLYAMKSAVTSLWHQVGDKFPNAVILVDGSHTIPVVSQGFGWLDVPWEQHAVVGGDDMHKAIGAASIIAKVHRDRYMTTFAEKEYPGYGFAKHVGYGTKQHREAIKQLGICEIHRRTFSGVYQYAK